MRVQNCGSGTEGGSGHDRDPKKPQKTTPKSTPRTAHPKFPWTTPNFTSLTPPQLWFWDGGVWSSPGFSVKSLLCNYSWVSWSLKVHWLWKANEYWMHRENGILYLTARSSEHSGCYNDLAAYLKWRGFQGKLQPSCLSHHWLTSTLSLKPLLVSKEQLFVILADESTLPFKSHLSINQSSSEAAFDVHKQRSQRGAASTVSAQERALPWTKCASDRHSAQPMTTFLASL